MTTDTDRTLRAIIGIAEGLAANLHPHLTTEHDLLPAELQATGSRDGGRSATHPDPVGHLATANATLEFDAELAEALGHLRAAQRRQNTILRQHPDRARDADATLRALRCDGSIDPLCVNNAVKGGLCWKCIKRRQRARHHAEHEAPPPVHHDVVEHASVDTSAPTTVAECGRCGWTTTALDIEHARLILEEHHLDGSCAA